MTEINFGISSFSRSYPGIPLEHRSMEIPESGELEKVSNNEYLEPNEAKPEKFDLIDYTCRDDGDKMPAVRFKLARGDSNDIYEMYLIWVNERSEWIGVWHNEWAEDFSTDESEIGPYSLDDYCRDMLSMAYGVNKKRLDVEISKTSPSELEKIAKGYQNG